ncbi:galactitol-specific PTS transporter subunit IIC [Shouchella clausii]|jgi:galactitol PTS system EIIC component|uniref:PTS galactitol transporter subunit IIC n=1 Tax=Shouchella clausii TaxID=79880 RepID=A0A268RUF0_SHOCL|nr:MULTISPECIES: galactitol-specific PTS transporter subunit IIC [Shouchella]ALA53761.1 PTS system, galactitol-specific IIC component [Shouchella clausii]MBU3229673.1 galactitol-specific PTS transporter subunit IIC [Shouchella clausii]MBU3264243.1 galactitol-specific PTS transporter subunit IIC [Shouchella clausii]MBU3506574.1 galactitol-specific PTS transporter subunit IIC [Shouchella clausii]MBU3533833.1 galactitol-specific PTS transporter subunit IIC [Shouchella clausii]
MDGFVNFIQGFLDLGATVILPVAIFLLGLLFGQKPGKAFRSGLTIGIAFVGIFLVVDLLVNNLGPAAQGMVDRLGVELNVIDVGWPASSSIAWASMVAAFIIPLGLLVNVLMLVTKTTKTMNVDIWNFWHYTFTAAMVYVATSNLFLSLLAAVIFQVICLKIADWTAPMVSEFYDLPGVSIATGSTISYAPGIFLVKGLQKLPGVNKWNADPATIEKRFGILGESMFIGLVLGAAIGLLAGYGIGDVIDIGIAMAAVMVLMPRMVKILMEGLLPISESAREWLNKRFGDREIYIGLDAAVALGHPSVISTALILVPITVALAIILPGNALLPFGDLATIPFIVAFIVGAARGNIVHSVIVGTIMIAISLYLATDVAPLFTQMAMEGNFTMPEDSAQISSIDQGGNLINWIIVRLFGIFD